MWSPAAAGEYPSASAPEFPAARENRIPRSAARFTAASILEEHTHEYFDDLFCLKGSVIKLSLISFSSFS